MNASEDREPASHSHLSKGKKLNHGALLAFIGGFIGGFSGKISRWASTLSDEFSLPLTIIFSATLAVLLYHGLKRLAERMLG